MLINLFAVGVLEVVLLVVELFTDLFCDFVFCSNINKQIKDRGHFAELNCRLSPLPKCVKILLPAIQIVFDERFAAIQDNLSAELLYTKTKAKTVLQVLYVHCIQVT